MLILFRFGFKKAGYVGLIFIQAKKNIFGNFLPVLFIYFDKFSTPFITDLRSPINLRRIILGSLSLSLKISGIRQAYRKERNTVYLYLILCKKNNPSCADIFSIARFFAEFLLDDLILSQHVYARKSAPIYTSISLLRTVHIYYDTLSKRFVKKSKHWIFKKIRLTQAYSS